MSLSLLLLRRLSSHHVRRFSSLPSSSFSATSTATTDPQKPTSLSARMSFVFDQIDAIEKERSQKDETLQRIRAWRESKKTRTQQENNDRSESGLAESKSGESEAAEKVAKKAVEVVHPWPEWIELMERLVKQNYFDHRRKDEEKMVEDLGFDVAEMGGVVEDLGIDFKDWKAVQAACLNFGRDRFDIMSLRNSCEKAYLLTNKEEEARTIDVMRILLTYGFDPINGSVVNESLLKIKSVKTVVRKLLHEMVKLSAVPIDPNLPPPVIKKPPPKVKQPPPPPRKRVGRDDVEMKKGDWLCPKCNFLNYRRNMVCFHCDHKRPPDEFMESQMQEKHHGPITRPGKVPNRTEVSNAWNFDFDDNESDGADVAAFEYADSRNLDVLGGLAEGENFRGAEDGVYMNGRSPNSTEREYPGPGPGPKQAGMGFDDFDDEEDDVESYELDNQNSAHKTTSIDFSELEVSSGSEDAEGPGEDQHAYRRTRTSSPRNKRTLRPTRRKAAFSGSEDGELDIDSDEDLPVHPDWKSSHVANSGQKTSRGARKFGSDEESELSSGSEDEEFPSRKHNGNRRGSSNIDFVRRGPRPFSGSESDNDLDFRRTRVRGSGAGLDRRRNTSNLRDSFDLSDDLRPRSRNAMGDRRNPSKDKGNGSSCGSRSNDRGFGGNDYGGSSRGSRGNDNRGFRGNDYDYNGSSRGSRGNHRGFGGDDYDGRRTNARVSGFRNSSSRGRESFGNQQRGRPSNKFDDSYFEEERPRRPRVNVR
ncbi:hypothetical protein RJ639_002300 [Escallonia herrerae]|uniref:RanBP2-type domain-containing protein n=1 Tax=Escallonia herrerae TaxID=1293975 RepID=A0AA88X8K7_9ASTE|nr:hypothetical protein RJ639_002300 [Escallonia herrerae]